MKEAMWANMKQTRTDAELDTLLERGGLGLTRREAILSAVLERVQADRRTKSRWRQAFVAAGTLGAVAALLLIMPRFSPHSPLRAKGVGAKPSISASTAEIDCLGATPDACPMGSLVIVRVAGVRGFISAWADPVGGGERIWYFAADSFSPLVDALSTSSAATTRAVKIGPEHRPGAYVVRVSVTERPMARREILGLPAEDTLFQGQFSLRVMPP